MHAAVPARRFPQSGVLRTSMNTTSSSEITESRWRTYSRALAFTLPAAVAWAFACTFLVPKALQVAADSGLDMSRLGLLWPATWLLVRWAGPMVVAGVLVFLLVEGVAPRWRRPTVGLATWMANFAVFFGLTMLLVVVLLAAPMLSQTP